LHSHVSVSAPRTSTLNLKFVGCPGAAIGDPLAGGEILPSA
jgi:hypothetical protein